MGGTPQFLFDKPEFGQRKELWLKVDGAVKSGFWVLVARNFKFTDGDNALFFGVIAGE
jgi:hypothetical protein